MNAVASQSVQELTPKAKPKAKAKISEQYGESVRSK
jgi:hypothetical protein